VRGCDATASLHVKGKDLDAVSKVTLNNREAAITPISKTDLAVAFDHLPGHDPKNNPPKNGDKWTLRLFVGKDEKATRELTVIGCGK